MKTIAQIAELAGISPATLRVHHKNAQKARERGTETATTLPAPAGKDESGRLTWDDDSITEWIAARTDGAPRGPVPRSVLASILTAALDGNMNRVIQLAKENLE